ncbi:hypothetical protein ACJX0J_010159, partial [Zea mays]
YVNFPQFVLPHIVVSVNYKLSLGHTSLSEETTGISVSNMLNTHFLIIHSVMLDAVIQLD